MQFWLSSEPSLSSQAPMHRAPGTVWHSSVQVPAPLAWNSQVAEELNTNILPGVLPSPRSQLWQLKPQLPSVAAEHVSILSDVSAIVWQAANRSTVGPGVGFLAGAANHYVDKLGEYHQILSCPKSPQCFP